MPHTDSVSPDLRRMTPEELTEFMKEEGEPAYRASQLFDWLHVKLIKSLDDATNLSKDLRGKLSEKASLTTLEIYERLLSQYDGTRKYLYRLPDDNVIESVFMRYRFGNSVCVSSQVGCAMGCRFCASTLDGVVRSLSAAEMLEQVYRSAEDTGERISHVVVMGSGEPLENTEELIRFIKLLSCGEGYGIGQRNITVSTCGVIPGIKRLMEEDLNINLALSLHAPDQETREKLMPVAKRYCLDELMETLKEYYAVTKRQLTFEYALAKGINDGRDVPEKLEKLLKGMDCVVNLIPVNPVTERNIEGTERTRVLDLKNQLEKRKIHATIRRELGRDINGACGQLRRKVIGGKA